MPGLAIPQGPTASRRRGLPDAAAVPAVLRRAIRRGYLAWGNATAPLTQAHLLDLFETLRHPVLDQHALLIRLTARPGCLGALTDVLERADQRHGVEIDLVIEDADEADVAGREARDLAERGLFVRWTLGASVVQGRDEAHVVRHLVEHALMQGVADVVSVSDVAPAGTLASKPAAARKPIASIAAVSDVTASPDATVASAAVDRELDRLRLRYDLPREPARRG